MAAHLMSTARDPFTTEAEMGPHLRPHVRTLAGTPVLWFAEVPAVNGIPDMSLVRFDAVETRRRNRHGLTMPDDLSIVRTALLLSERPAGLGVDELARSTRLSQRLLKRRVLPTLSEHGWVTSNDGVWRMTRRYSDPAALLVTIELKLRDWRKALTQALHASVGADAAWVVLDSRSTSATDQVRHFQVRGVGLALLDRQNLEIVHPARPANCDPARRAVLAERLLRMKDAGVRVGPERHVFGRILT